MQQRNNCFILLCKAASVCWSDIKTKKIVKVYNSEVDCSNIL